MKKLAAVIIAAAAAGIFTGCGIFGGNDIGREEALAVALADAGVDEADTTRLKVSEDRDDGRKIYEIQFDAGDREYDYEIQASDGKILSADTEMVQNASQNQSSGTQNDTSSGTDTAQNSGSAQNSNSTGSAQDQSGSGNTQNNSGTNTANVAITLEQATAIALERVPGATDRDIRISLDYDDGIQKYEGDIIYDQKEYDFEIDANTGTILEWSEERV